MEDLHLVESATSTPAVICTGADGRPRFAKGTVGVADRIKVYCFANCRNYWCICAKCTSMNVWIILWPINSLHLHRFPLCWSCIHGHNTARAGATDQRIKIQCGEVSDKKGPYNTLYTCRWVRHTVTIDCQQYCVLILKPSEPQNYSMEPHACGSLALECPPLIHDTNYHYQII